MAAKVYLRDISPNASYQDKEFAFKKMVSAFTKAVAEAGILHECKKRKYYESPGEKRRRKRKESAQNRLKEKLRENFPERRRPDKDNKVRNDQ